MKMFKLFVGEIRAVYQKSKDCTIPKIQIKSSKDAADWLRMVWDEGNIEYIEEFYVIALNRANNTIGYFYISKGGITGTLADQRVIFQHALLSNSTGLILAHCHPSGNVNPSEADKKLTRRLVEAGKILDIPILDHIILTADSYYSFADEGTLLM